MSRIKNSKNLLYIILFSIGIIAIVVFAISLLIAVWSGNDNNENSNANANTQTEVDGSNYDDIKLTGKVGKYNNITWSTEKQVKYYTRWICDALKTKNINRIKELISPEYVEYFGLSDEKLISLLETKGMWGKTLDVDKYEYVTFGDNKVFKLHIYSSDKSVEDYVNLIEYTPKKVAISFDSFVTTNKEAKEYIRDNVKYTFSNEIFFDTKYKVNLKITNNSDSDIILNTNKDYENIYLDFSTLTSVRVISTVFAGQTVTLKPNSEFNTVLEFNVENLAFSKIKGVTLKDVIFTKNNITKDVEIEF